MKPLLAALAALGVLATLAVALVGSLSADPPTNSQRADALASELRCPDCQGLSVADSPTEAAAEIRRQIDALVADGASDDEVRAHFEARYGEWILLAPSSPLLWAIPLAVVITGAVALVTWLLRSGRRPASAERPIAVDTQRRLHEEAEALDA